MPTSPNSNSFALNYDSIPMNNRVRSLSPQRSRTSARVRSLSPSRSDLSSRETSPRRPRETSPLRHVFSSGNRTAVDDATILEDVDEAKGEPKIPILPVFNKEQQQMFDRQIADAPVKPKLKGRMLTTSEDRLKKIQDEIEGDFDQEFYKDTGIKKPQVKQERGRSQHVDLGDPESSADEVTDDELHIDLDQDIHSDLKPDESSDQIDFNSESADDDEPTYEKMKHMFKKFTKNDKKQESIYPEESRGSRNTTAIDTTKPEHADILETTRNTYDTSGDPQPSFLSRLFHLGTNSVFPGGTRRNEKPPVPDEEQLLLDEEFCLDDAKGMVGHHIQMDDLSPMASSQSQQLKSLDRQEFFMSPPFQGFDEFANVDSNRPRKVRAGVTSSLMHLYNPINSSARDAFSDSELDLVEGYNEANQIPYESGAIHDDNKIRYKLKRTISQLRLHPHGTASDSFQVLSPQSSRESHTAKFTKHARSISGSAMSSILSKDKRNNSTEKIGLPQFLKTKSKSSSDVRIDKKRPSAKDIVSRKLRKKIKKNHLMAGRITVHIADLLQRQIFVLKLCKAFMTTGFPNHRLEEYMMTTVRVLEIDGSFIYIPGCMIVSFGDPATRTSEVKLVRVAQGLDVGKLDEAHEIFKSVVKDRVGVEYANQKLDELLNRPPYYNVYWSILWYGLSSCTVIPWAFGGSWLDLPPTFVLGCLLGFLQLVVAPKSTIYSSVFEVSCSVWLSFIGRAIGTIGGGKYFCFSAVVQGGLCMILPGYIILSGALELQSRNIVSGSVRMFYAIIYSMFLGFGLTLGSAIYGWMDSNATTNTTCTSNISVYWRIFFVPVFTLLMALTCQAKWHQVTIMTVIACGGYVASYFSSLHFTITEFNSALGSFTIGLMSYLYSRTGASFTKIGYCNTAFTSMLPGIFDQVPGGVASRNILAAGIKQLSNSSDTSGTLLSGTTLSFGIAMIEIAIGITVGLFFAELIIFPFGNKTGLFRL